MKRNWSTITERVRSETVLSAAKAAKLIPSDRSRRGHVSIDAIVKWILNGKRGVFLDGFKAGGKAWFTSKEAIDRFIAALSEVEAGRAAPTLADASPSELQRRASKAMTAWEEELATNGPVLRKGVRS